MGYIEMKLDMNDHEFIRKAVNRMLDGAKTIKCTMDVTASEVDEILNIKIVKPVDEKGPIKEILLQEGIEEAWGGTAIEVEPKVLEQIENIEGPKETEPHDEICTCDECDPDGTKVRVEYEEMEPFEPTIEPRPSPLPEGTETSGPTLLYLDEQTEEIQAIEDEVEIHTDEDDNQKAFFTVVQKGCDPFAIGQALPIYASDDHSYNNKGNAHVTKFRWAEETNQEGSPTGVIEFETDDVDLAMRKYRIENGCLYEVKVKIEEPILCDHQWEDMSPTIQQCTICMVGRDKPKELKKRRCSICREAGHNKKNCPNKDRELIGDLSNGGRRPDEPDASEGSPDAGEEPKEEVPLEGGKDEEIGTATEDQEGNTVMANIGGPIESDTKEATVSIDDKVIAKIDEKASFKITPDDGESIPKGWKRTSSGALMEDLSSTAEPEKISDEEIIKIVKDGSDEKGMLWRDLMDATKQYEKMSVEMGVDKLIDEGKLYEPVLGTIKVL